jgi:putative alpha-1,2-mannosidase
MTGNRIKYFIILSGIILSELSLYSQEGNYIKYVNPFIGTSRTKVKSQWGSEGGTYPGAVAPYGFVQLTPETNVSSARGYNYTDSVIYFFSCINHMSGYPNGSSGNIQIMPVEKKPDIQIGKYNRRFLHQDEKTVPGFYSVLFRDNGTLAEATSSERTGMFRFTFPRGVTPAIFLGDLGKIEVKSKRTIHGSRQNTVIYFSLDIINKQAINGGMVFTFNPDSGAETELIVRLGVSSAGFESTEMNIRDESGSKSFTEFKEQNQEKWNHLLSVIEIQDPSADNKTKFYTALYHSSLLPWIISDVKGNYKGADRKIHKTNGRNQYGAFSPWDTFRSLHPLLCLIAPERQKDMILSLLDHFNQTGRLPQGPMTGNHIMAIITDSWMKGIRGYDSALVYKAMKATLDSASRHPDMAAYLKLGFVPSSFAESVTLTVEYAYDDWIMSQFASVVSGEESDAGKFLKRSFSYRNLLDTGSLFMVPRLGTEFMTEPGYYGYKEGDKWSYSLFVPHNPVDLINLSGGPEEFSVRLDSALANDLILFDNEPVLHVPYLFNYSMNRAGTQKWVRTIMKSHYKNSPDGLPGNDDLGAMSSWYLFSAMGFFPLSPGRPFYDLGSPLFEKVTLHLANNKKLTIRSENNGDENYFVKSVEINGRQYNKSWISHAELTNGSEIIFAMENKPESSFKENTLFDPISETKEYSDFQILDFNLPGKKVKSGEPFSINFSVRNSGNIGTKPVRAYCNGKACGRKNILVATDTVVTDSIQCCVYPVGIIKIHIDNLPDKEVEVTEPLIPFTPELRISDLESVPVFKKGEYKNYTYTIQNQGGYRDSTDVIVFADDSLIQQDHIVLDPGEQKKVVHALRIAKPGLYKLQAGSESLKIRIYDNRTDAKIVDLHLDEDIQGDSAQDNSGFSNNGLIINEDKVQGTPPLPFSTGKSSFIEFRNSPSLDIMGEEITVMAWICPTEENRGLTDIITKGDFIALQSSGNRTISFFAGGWGRGSCEAILPDNWTGNWHHITGVSDGYTLKLYIDGIESGSMNINSPVNLSYKGKWMIGRNEEFPGERFFHGAVKHFKIFTEALTGSEIKQEMARK